MADVYDDYLTRAKIERAEQWDDWTKNAPWIEFPAGWQVKVTPPFRGALMRFRVKLPSGTEKSVYFDAHERLGCYNGPYWEVYPYRGDVGRCDPDDVSMLLHMIGDERDADTAGDAHEG